MAETILPNGAQAPIPAARPVAAQSTTKRLPPGWTLDWEPGDGQPVNGGLPEGWKLDEPVVADAQPSLLDNIRTNLAMTPLGAALDISARAVEPMITGEKPSNDGMIDNFKNNAAQRGMEMLGGAARGVALVTEPIADFLERNVPLGAIEVTDQGLTWRKQTPEEIAGKSDVLQRAEKLSNNIAKTDFNYRQYTSWEDAKNEPLKNFLPWAVESGIMSVPDMVAMTANLPGYIAARSGEMAQDRAKNNGIENATLGDLLVVAPAATASALIDRISLGKTLGLTDEIAVNGAKAALKATGASIVREAGTEAVQQGIEDTATNFGTKNGMTLGQGLENMAAAALGGGVFGGFVRGPTAALEAIQSRKDNTSSVEPAPAVAPETAGEGANSPLAASPVDPVGRAMLRENGVTDDMIDGMGREEFAGMVEEARKAGVNVSPQAIADAARYEAARKPADAQTAAPVSQPVQAENAAVARPVAESAPIQTPNSTGITPADVLALRQAGEQQAAMLVDQIPATVQRRPRTNISGNLPINDLVALNKATQQSVAEDVATGQPIPPAPAVPPSRFAGMTPTQIVERAGRRVPMQGVRQGPVNPTLNIRNMADLARIAREGVATDLSQAQRRQMRDQIIAKGEALSPDVRRDLMRVVRESLAGDIELAARIENEANTLFQVTPKAPEINLPTPKAAPVKKPMNLITLLAKTGGLKDSGGELRAMDLHKKFVPGSGRLVRNNGRTLDDATRFAIEEGYIPPGSTISDFLSALDQDNRSGSVFSSQQADEANAWKSEQENAGRGGPDAMPDRTDVRDNPDNPYGLTDENIADFDATYRRVTSMGFSSEVADRVMSLMTGPRGFGDGYRFETALEFATDQSGAAWVNIAAPTPAVANLRNQINDVPFFGDPEPANVQDTRAAPEVGDSVRTGGEVADRPSDTGSRDAASQEPAADGEVQAGRSGEDRGSSDRESAAVSQPEAVSEKAPQRPAEPRTEAGADGKPQMVIPGAERANDVVMAQRKADAPMKPKVAQKDAGGLFSDDANQMDLVDLSRQKPKDDLKLEQPAPDRTRKFGDGVDVAPGVAFRDQELSDPPAGKSIYAHARDVILENGRKTGNEYLAAFDKGGALVEYGTDGRGANVALSSFLVDAAQNPMRQLVIMHNHPSGASFSAADIGILGAPGIHSLWVFGHNGRNDRVKISPAMLGKFSSLRLPVDERIRLMLHNAKRSALHGGRALTELLNSGAVDRAELDAAWQIVPMEVLRRAGIVEFNTNRGYDFAASPEINAAIDSAAKILSKEVFYGSEDNYHAGRSSIDFRHDAEVEGSSWLLSQPAEDRFDAGRGNLGSTARDQTQEGMGRDRGPQGGQQVRDELGRFAKSPYTLAEEVSRAPVPDTVKPEHVPATKLTSRIAQALRTTERKAAKGVKSHNAMDRRSIKDDETVAQIAMRKLIDYLDPVARMQNQIGEKLNDFLDVYQTARLAEGTIRHEIHQISDKYVGPMAQSLARVGATLEDLHKYLLAKHAPERNRVVGLRNEEGSDLYRAATDPDVKGASGISTNEARKMMADLAQDAEKFAGIKEAASFIRQMLDASLAEQRRSGLISDETYDLLSNQWKDYVPLKGEELQDPDNGYMPGLTSGFDVRGKESKAATGRYSDAENVITHAVIQSERTVIRQEKNKVIQTFLRLINKFDPAGKMLGEVYWSGEDGKDGFGDITRAKDVYKHELDKSGKVVLRKVPNPFARRDDVVACKVGGKVYYIKPADPKVGLALRKMTIEQISAASRVVGIFTNMQSLVNTRMNPAFTPINILRDVQTGAIFLKDEGFSTSEVAKTVASIPSAWGALWRYARSGKLGDGEWDQHLRDFMDAGGKINFDQFNTIEGMQKRLEADVKNAGKRRPVYALGKLLSDINDTAENGFRLATYVAARGKGITNKRAAFMARDLTVDFQKRGEWSSEISRWYVFFNAAVQGNFNVAKRLVKSRAIKGVVLGMIGMGAFQHLVNTLLSGTDDDGESYYQKMLRDEPWKFERQMLFFLPGSDKYVTFPLPFGLNAFWHAGVQGAAVTSGYQAPGAAALNTIAVAVDAFNPLGSGSPLAVATPTIGDPVVELLSNENFFGAPIYPSANPFDKSPDPDSQVSFPRTAGWAKWVAEGLGDLTGGTEIRPGAVEVHPDTLEYLWGFFTGGVGRFASQSIETVTRATDADFEPAKTPWVRSFYGEFAESSQRNEYYSQRERVYKVKGWLDKARKDRNVTELEDIKREYPQDTKAINAFVRSESTMRELNKNKRRIEASDMPAAEKKRRIEAIDKRQTEIMNRARKAYYEAGKDL